MTTRHYAGLGQSNLGGNNGDNLVGVRLGRVRAVWDAWRALGDPDWFNPSTTEEPQRIGPLAGIAEAFAARPESVRLYKKGIGSTTAQQWIDTHLAAAIADMQAMQAFYGFSTWDGIIWDQGESDTGVAAAYEGKLTSIVGTLRTAFPNVPISIRLMPPNLANSTTLRAAQTAVAALSPYTMTHHIDEFDNTQHDGLHFTGPVERISGMRALVNFDTIREAT